MVSGAESHMMKLYLCVVFTDTSHLCPDEERYIFVRLSLVDTLLDYGIILFDLENN